jgi:hypothetical protein
MDLHTIGQKAVLHDCIRSQLADEVCDRNMTDYFGV